MTQSLNTLLFLTLVYIATCKEEKLIKPGEEFRPFVSIPNYGAIQENIQVLDELDPQSFEGDSFLSFKIKCLSLSQYSIYDIKGLGANSMSGRGEIAYTTPVTINGKTYTILYNFCYDLKTTDKCEEEGHQIAYLGDDDKCKYIGDGIKDGNTWKFIPKTNIPSFLKDYLHFYKKETYLICFQIN